MDAIFICKRNESLQWMWACLKGAELLVWIGCSEVMPKNGGFIFLPLLLGVPMLLMSAFVHFVFACERYLTVKDCSSTSVIAISVFLASLIVSVFCAVCFESARLGLLAYVSVPVVFSLAGLMLKMIPNLSPSE